jgi:AraC family transcriptional regulator
VRPEDYLNNVRPDGTASYLELNARPPALSSRNRGWEGFVVECDRFFPFDNGEVVYDEHMIVLFLGPKAHVSFSVDGRRTDGLYGNGDLILSPCEQPVRWRLSDTTDALMLSIRPEVIGRKAQEVSEADSAKVCIIGTPRMQDPLVRQIGLTLMAELQGPGIGERLYVDSLLNTLGLHLLRNYSSLCVRPRLPHDRGLPAAKLRRAVEAINDRIEAGISLSELAEAVGVSVSHFEVLFRRSTGLSPHQYLLQQRVDRARELLGDEALSLAEVAARAGFCDQSHLTRHFRRIVGVTPGQYRKGS